MMKSVAVVVLNLMKTLHVGLEEEAPDITLLLFESSLCRVVRPLAIFIGEKKVHQRCSV
jgi:hypothetical protein